MPRPYKFKHVMNAARRITLRDEASAVELARWCGVWLRGCAGNTVVCPLHAWKISPETGSVTKPEAEPACVATYLTRIESGIVLIEVPASSTEKQGNPLFCGEQNRAALGDSSVPSPAL
jgi:hypothetical protein